MLFPLKFTSFCTIIVIGFACADSKMPAEKSEHGDENLTNIRYAQNFKVELGSGYRKLLVVDPWPEAGLEFEYYLVPKTADLPPHIPIDNVIRTPVDRVVVTSTSHIPLLEYLDRGEKLIAFPSTDFISSPRIRQLIEEEKIVDLGPLAGINLETLIDLQPDLIMGYGAGREYETFQTITDLGLQVVMNADYMEKTALGRAEWIKFAALFLQQEELADSIFGAIQTSYDTLRKLALSGKPKPSVYSGIMYGDTWFMPGGDNFAAQFIQDAGGDYLWKQTTEQGWLELSFEAVYENAHNADKWIGVGSFGSLQEIAQSDHKYVEFEAFTQGEVYNYNARIGEKGGFAFFEWGYSRPDLVLADLIKITHPSLLPDYDLYFYQKLK